MTSSFGTSLEPLALTTRAAPVAPPAPASLQTPAPHPPHPPTEAVRQTPQTSATASPVGAELQTAIDRINAQLATHAQSLRLSVDTQSHQTIILVQDTQSGALIRQIPNEDVLRLAASLSTSSSGLLDLTA